ncbi:MAG: Nif3-like dinuclear metal center hexameric protein [Gemmatimonadales bacterium]
MGIDLSELVDYLDGYLRVAEVPDEPNAVNGLQVEVPGPVARIAVAVDGCQATIDAAADREANLLIVHHGIFWGGVEPLAGRHGSRVRSLINGGISLYSAHIPLDVHPEVGNNAVLGRLLCLADPTPFGDYHGVSLGVAGVLDLPRGELVSLVASLLDTRPMLIPAGPERVGRLGIITGAGGGMIRVAAQAGVDTLLTGEGAHHTYFDAEEWNINVVYAGHYATETVGVKALAEHLDSKFRLPWEFIDHPTGL